MTDIISSFNGCGDQGGFGPNGELIISSGKIVLGGEAVPQLIIDQATSGFSQALQMKKFRAALGRVYAGTGRGRILVIGDSTTAGLGAGSSGTSNSVGAFAKSRVRSLATRLAALGIPTSDNSFFGDQGMITLPTSYPLYDTRITFGANWSMPSGGSTQTQGGQMTLYTNGAVNNMTFTPSGQVDSAIVYYARSGSNGSFAWNVDGGTSFGTITTNGGPSLTASTPATFTKGSHAITFVPSNNGNFYIAGVVAWDSTIPAIDIIQAGISGSLIATQNITTSSWHPGNAVAVIAPDLTIIQITINDANANTPVATYKSTLQSVVTRCLAVGDVIIESGIPSSGAGASLAAVVQAAKEVAIASNVPFLDIGARWVDYATANALGWMSDTLHPNAVGYPDVSRSEASFIASMG